MILFYYGLMCLAHILALPFLFFFAFKTKYQQSIPLRFFYPKNYSKQSFDIWLHACSFGEVRSLQTLIESIPNTQSIFLSVITQTGFNEAHKLYEKRENLQISYLPFESLLPFFAPKCKKLFVFEAELWLMLFVVAKRNHAQTKLINARISTRSFKRYLKMKFFYQYLFSFIDCVLSQSQDDTKRLQTIGAKNVQTLGNLKSTIPIIPTKNYPKPKRLIIVIASTHANEEQGILQALKKLKTLWENLYKRDSLNSLNSQDSQYALDSRNSQNVRDSHHVLNLQDSQNIESRNIEKMQLYLHNPMESKDENLHKDLQDSQHVLDSQDIESTSKNPYRQDCLHSQALRDSLNSLDSQDLQNVLDSHNTLNLQDSRNIESQNIEKMQHYLHNPTKSNHISKDNANALFIFVPRHPERFNEVYDLLLQEDSKTIRFSSIIKQNQQKLIDFDTLESNFLLIDTMGELINLYAISDIVILGGGYEKIGGHNPLEVAVYQNELLSGKEIFNQRATFELISNYYLSDIHEIPSLLESYKILNQAQLNTSLQTNIIETILQES